MEKFYGIGHPIRPFLAPYAFYLGAKNCVLDRMMRTSMVISNSDIWRPPNLGAAVEVSEDGDGSLLPLSAL